MRASLVETTVKEEAGLIIEAWTATSRDGRRWLVTCGRGEKGESYVNATLRRGRQRHQYLPSETADRMLAAARMSVS